MKHSSFGVFVPQLFCTEGIPLFFSYLHFFLYPFWPRCAWFPLQKNWRLYFLPWRSAARRPHFWSFSVNGLMWVLTYDITMTGPSHWLGFMLFLAMFFCLGIGFFPVFSACTYMYPCTQSHTHTHTHTHGRTCVRVGR